MTKKTEKGRSSSPGPMFVYGLDDAGKPRGARFASARDDIVKAAQELRCLVAISPPPGFAEIGVKLPLGRIYSSGKAFVPNIRRALYDKLVEEGKKLGNAEPVAPSKKADKGPDIPTVADFPPQSLPNDWEGIEVGHLVLVQESPADGWWEVVVIERHDRVLTVAYRDYPKWPAFMRNIDTVALINPNPK